MQWLAADFYMSLYNVIFTVLPPLVIGIFDQDVDREMSRLHPGQLDRSSDFEALHGQLYPGQLHGWLSSMVAAPIERPASPPHAPSTCGCSDLSS